MTVAELKAKLDDFGDHVEVRVGFSGEPRKIVSALEADAARILDVDYFGAGSSSDSDCVVVTITA
jgi:hypothetical protein